jgi:hypothetical protein
VLAAGYLWHSGKAKPQSGKAVGKKWTGREPQGNARNSEHREQTGSVRDAREDQSVGFDILHGDAMPDMHLPPQFVKLCGTQSIESIDKYRKSRELSSKQELDVVTGQWAWGRGCIGG